MVVTAVPPREYASRSVRCPRVVHALPPPVVWPRVRDHTVVHFLLSFRSLPGHRSMYVIRYVLNRCCCVWFHVLRNCNHGIYVHALLRACCSQPVPFSDLRCMRAHTRTHVAVMHDKGVAISRVLVLVLMLMLVLMPMRVRVRMRMRMLVRIRMLIADVVLSFVPSFLQFPF